MWRSSKVFCHSVFASAFFLVAGLVLSASADPQARLPPGAKVVQAQDTTIGKNGAYSDLFIPQAVSFTLDYEVEPGRQLTVGIITAAQFQQIGQGRKMTGQPMYKFVIQGIGAEARLFIPRGNFVLTIVNYDGVPARLSYRASYVPM